MIAGAPGSRKSNEEQKGSGMMTGCTSAAYDTVLGLVAAAESNTCQVNVGRRIPVMK